MKVIIIGAGNVGGHLAKALYEAKVDVLQLFSRDTDNIKVLAKEIGSEPLSDLKQVSKEADVYLLSVSDQVIEEVAKKLSKVIGKEKLVAHTSGATPSTVLKPYFQPYGVFYPLQTFSKDQEVNFSSIPFCIDANEQEGTFLLEQLAAILSEKVYLISDEQRAVLHIAAVFINNFTNHLVGIGQHIAEKEGMTFDLLLPLLEETVAKLKRLSPEAAQTGPAKRGDEATIERHLKYLEKYPAYREVYEVMTQSIRDTNR